VLDELGWNAANAEAFAPYAARGLAPGRVIAQHRGGYAVSTAEGDLLADAPRSLRSDRVRRPAVGDWVAAELRADGKATVRAVLPRHSVLRKAAGDTMREQVVAANVDVVLVVTSLDDDLKARRLERYLALVLESGARPAIVISKVDLEGDRERALALVATVAVASGTPVHLLSARSGEGLAEIRSYLVPGRTVALLGSSGVGKSTLLNVLLGSEVQRTAEVRADGKGRHTTTTRELFRIPGGGIVLDTPGMREMQLWESEVGVDEAFADVVRLVEECRFPDCRHVIEPGCAVLAAVEAGLLPGARLESFRQLRGELEANDERIEAKRRAQRDPRPAPTFVRRRGPR
jgi:ribosome biogenesis GTPase